MITIPNQSSVAKVYEQFDDAGRMKPSAFYDRVVDVMEELVKFTLLTRGAAAYLTSRYSERKEEGARAKPQAAAVCCGGPALVEMINARCVADADAKRAGKAGCGCNAAK